MDACKHRTARLSGFRAAIAIASTLFALSASAQDSEYDPWEGFNRSIFNFNEGADRLIAKPLAVGYRAITPDPVERSVSRVFSNLAEVRNVLNNLLQGKPGRAAHDGGRFLVNSTLGLLGIFEVADKMGLSKADDEDFGQTLAHWGVARGPYLMLPFMGPSSLRGAVSLPFDSLADPVSHINDVPTRNSVLFVDLIELRASLLDTEGLISGDKYIFIREAYLQRRDYLINDGLIEDDSFDDFEDEDY